MLINYIIGDFTNVKKRKTIIDERQQTYKGYLLGKMNENNKFRIQSGTVMGSSQGCLQYSDLGSSQCSIVD